MSEKITISARQKKILKCLEETSDLISLKEIGGKIGCSYKTVQNELITIRKYLPEGWSIHTVKGIGVYLAQPTNETVTSEFTHDENNLLFILIELLLDRSYTLEKLCEEVYLSRKSTLQLIASAEEFIQGFFLKMQRKPFQIIGSEGPKRLLLFEINLSNKGISNHYAVLPHDMHLQPAKDNLAQYYGIHLTNYGFNAFYNFINICLNRTKSGFDANDLPHSMSSKVKKEPLFIDMQPFFDDLEVLLKFKLPMQERVYIYLALIYTEYQFTILYEKNRNNLLKAHKDYIEFMDFVRFLEGNLTLSIADNEDLLFSIFNLYQVSQLRNVSPELQYLPQESILRTVKNNSEQAYKLLHDLCNEWSNDKDFIFNRSNILSLVVLLNRHVSNLESLKTEILLVTSRSFFLKDYNGIFKTNFEGRANFKTIDASHIVSEEDIPPETDIIITDSLHSINTPNIEVILISQIITDKDIQDISRAIDSIKREKKDTMFSKKGNHYFHQK